MKNIFKFSLITSLCIFMYSCETTELDLLESPNSVTVESADPNFVLNQIQLSFNGVVGGFSGTDSGLTRLTYQFGAYNAQGGSWAGAYSLFSNVDFLEQVIATNELDLPNHSAIANILEAYSYMILVDHFDKVPFSEANQPEDFPNPSSDDGDVIYDAQLALLDTAIDQLNQDSAIAPEDFFFGTFSKDNWIALANTLKIRAYNNIRLVDPAKATAGINSVLGSNIIDTVAEDFQFLFNASSPSGIFSGNYSAGASNYQSNYLYDLLNAGDAEPPFMETGTPDPRLRYYIYRQRDQVPSGSNLPCTGNSAHDYCYVGNKYWGRDHADIEGIPNDVLRRSTFGVYPGGGAFDNDDFVLANLATNTLSGAGVTPIYLSSTTHFALAEAALTLGTGGGTPVGLLEAGIRLSMEKVIGFASGLQTTNTDDGTDYAATSADVDAYVAGVVAEFNGASSSGKLEIIAREQWLASFGNGLEPYNTYRRTGFPNLQSPIFPATAFPRSWRYPNSEVDNNTNLEQTQPTKQVFWDNNPANFID